VRGALNGGNSSALKMANQDQGLKRKLKKGKGERPGEIMGWNSISRETGNAAEATVE